MIWRVLGLSLCLASVAPATAAGTCPALLDVRLPGLLEPQVDLCRFQGRVLMVVNTASACGYTPQYDGLEKLYRRYQDRGLVILGAPANDFGGQEPGSDRDIAEFCRANYGVTFPMLGKTVVSGRDANALFKQLAAKSGAAPQWNFHKYLIDRRGERVQSFPSAVEPSSPRLAAAIESLLAERR